MKRLIKRGLTIVGSLALVTGLIAPSIADAAPTYPTPVPDKFFHLSPKEYVKKPAGKLVRSRSFPHIIAPGGTVTQMVFTTRNSFNRPTYATATLIRPVGFRKNGNVVVLNDFINSLGIGCQPTYAFSSLNPEWVSRSATVMIYASLALAYGWAVLLPDHEGVHAAYTANKLAGHIVLDAVRAAKSTPSFNVSHSWTGMMGYSGGGMVSLWAADLAPRYAPSVRFDAIAVGGIPTDLTFYGKVLGNRSNPAFGLAMASLVGLEREYGSHRMNVTPRLSPHGREKLTRHRDACSPRLLKSFEKESVGTMFRKGVTFNPQREKKAFQVLAENSLVFDHRSPRAGTKIFVFNSTNDIGAPFRPLRKTLRRYCRAGSKVELLTMDNPDHVAVGFRHIPDAANWMGRVANGKPIHNDCARLLKSGK